MTVSNEKNIKRLNKRKYDEIVRQALLTIWNTANQICSKRLVPFMPDLLVALERFGHLSLPEDVRKRLLELSSATVPLWRQGRWLIFKHFGIN